MEPNVKIIKLFTPQSDRRGSTLGEYGVIAGLIAVTAITSMAALGERVSETFEAGAETVGSEKPDLGASHEQAGEAAAPPVPPGDVPSNETTLGYIPLGESVQSDLEDSSDHDWFRVAMPQTANVYINAKSNSIDGQSAKYLNIDFRRFDGSRIDEENSTDSVDLIVNDVPAGDYFVDIRSYRSGDLGGYELYADLVADITNTHGPSSQVHSIGGANQSEILPGDRGDSFVFDITESGDYLFEASGTGSLPMEYINIAVQNASGGSLGGVSNKSHSKLMLNDLDVGRYYARVRGYSYNALGDYLLSSRGIEDIPGTISGAEPYSMGDIANAEIFTSDDVDRFSFTTTTAGDYSFEIEGSSESPLSYMELEIRDASNALIDEDRGSTGASVTISNLPSGDYTARVFSCRSSGIGGYQFQGSRISN